MNVLLHPDLFIIICDYNTVADIINCQLISTLHKKLIENHTWTNHKIVLKNDAMVEKMNLNFINIKLVSNNITELHLGKLTNKKLDIERIAITKKCFDNLKINNQIIRFQANFKNVTMTLYRHSNDILSIDCYPVWNQFVESVIGNNYPELFVSDYYYESIDDIPWFIRDYIKKDCSMICLYINNVHYALYLYDALRVKYFLDNDLKNKIDFF